MAAVLPSIADRNPSHRWISLTLTVRNCDVDSLGDSITTLTAAWGRLLKAKPLRLVAGAIRTIETTRAHDGTAHPHVHALLLVRPSYMQGTNYLSTSKWEELWKQALRADYLPQVSATVLPKGDTASLMSCLSYITKSIDLTSDPEWFIQYLMQTKRRKLIVTSGSIREELRKNKWMGTEEGEAEPPVVRWQGRDRKYVIA